MIDTAQPIDQNNKNFLLNIEETLAEYCYEYENFVVWLQMVTRDTYGGWEGFVHFIWADLLSL